MSGSQTRTPVPITLEQRRRQLALEQQAAREILASTRVERSEVTRRAYDRLYQEAPWHPDLHTSPGARLARVRRHAALLTRHVARARGGLEVGCGSGDLLTSLARQRPGTTFVGLDISVEKLSSGTHARLPNLRFQAGDCVEPHEPTGFYDLVISSQVLEHLHPEDVPAHLRAVRRVLAPGGVFALDTPNRWTGPHDVSAYFSRVACGTHLKEWTFAELQEALRMAGFARLHSDAPLVAHLRRILPLAGDMLLLPVGAKVALERVLHTIPARSLRRTLFRLARMSNILLYAQSAG